MAFQGNHTCGENTDAHLSHGLLSMQMMGAHYAYCLLTKLWQRTLLPAQ